MARALDRALGKMQAARGGLIFLSGDLAGQIKEVAQALSALRSAVPFIVAAGHGVYSEREEIHGESAAAAIVWASGQVRLHTLTDDLGTNALEMAASSVGLTPTPRATSALLFTNSGRTPPDKFGAAFPLPLIGAGSAGDHGTCSVDEHGGVLAQRGAMFVFHGLPAPSPLQIPGFRLLTPLRRVSETHGSLLVSIEQQSALDAVQVVGQQLQTQSQLLLALELDPRSVRADGQPELVVRALQGVDPARRALLVSSDLRPGMRVAFAVEDTQGAREELRRSARQLHQNLAGAAPQFGVFINSASRNQARTGSEIRVLQDQFRGMPLAGMHATFALASASRTSGPPRALIQHHTRVFGLFRSPS